MAADRAVRGPPVRCERGLPRRSSQDRATCLLGSSGREPGELQEVGTPRFDATWLGTVLEKLKDWGAAAGLALASGS